MDSVKGESMVNGVGGTKIYIIWRILWMLVFVDGGLG